MAGDEDRCRAAGCDDYLTKPIVPRMLYQAIARNIKSRARLKLQSRGAREGLENGLREIRKRFAATLPGTLDQLKGAYERSRPEDIAVLAHRLKGSVSTLGFTLLGDAAAALQDALREPSPPDITLRRLAKLIEVTKQAIAESLNERSD